MKLIIVRHGETVENLKKIVQGQSHGNLSELGKKQSLLVSENLKNEKIDVIYSSDLNRCTAMTELISKHHKDTPTILTPSLRERNPGDIVGKSKSEVEYDKVRKKYLNLHMKSVNGESLEDLHKRANDFISSLIKKHSEDNVVLVTHSGIGLIMIGILLEKNIDEVLEMDQLANGSISVLDIDNKKNIKVISVNDNKHLGILSETIIV